MKTVTEIHSVELKSALSTFENLTKAGKTPEEISQAIGEAFKREGEKLKFFIGALETVRGRDRGLKRVVVLLPQEKDKIPEGGQKREEHVYLAEYYPALEAKPRGKGRFAGRGERDRGKGRGDKKRGKRQDKRGEGRDYQGRDRHGEERGFRGREKIGIPVMSVDRVAGAHVGVSIVPRKTTARIVPKGSAGETAPASASGGATSEPKDPSKRPPRFRRRWRPRHPRREEGSKLDEIRKQAQDSATQNQTQAGTPSVRPVVQSSEQAQESAKSTETPKPVIIPRNV